MEFTFTEKAVTENKQMNRGTKTPKQCEGLESVGNREQGYTDAREGCLRKEETERPE